MECRMVKNHNDCCTNEGAGALCDDCGIRHATNAINVGDEHNDEQAGIRWKAFASRLEAASKQVRLADSRLSDLRRESNSTLLQLKQALTNANAARHALDRY